MKEFIQIVIALSLIGNLIVFIDISKHVNDIHNNGITIREVIINEETEHGSTKNDDPGSRGVLE